MSLNHSVLRFKFDDFASITESTGEPKFSEEKTDSQGNSWILQLKTGDIEDSGPDDNDTNVGLYLQNMGKTAITLKYSTILRDADGRIRTEFVLEKEIKPDDSWGPTAIIKRSIVLDQKNNILRDKALHVDVHLQIKSDDEVMNKIPSSFSDKALKLLESEEGVDVSFKVGDAVMSAVIHAHKFMLRMNAPILFGFCGGKDDESPIPVSEITSEVFMIILRYIYAEEVPGRKLIKRDGKNILDAANRFGLIGLKLFVETSLVQFIRLENAVEWLLFADSKACALLKEHAMSFIVARSGDILNCGTFAEQLQDSPQLLMEVTKEISNGLTNDQRFGDANHASVNQLRKRLHAKGLDVDGTKEMLIARLNQSNKRRKTKK